MATTNGDGFMDSPDSGQFVKILTTLGKGEFIECDYFVPPLEPLEIRVESVFTGVCRSDIDMMNGKFPLLPMSMHGHEGLGQVVARGSGVHDYDVKVGDYVATRGEPAYADEYNANDGTFVKVPRLDPKYIIEPVCWDCSGQTYCSSN